MTWCTVVIKGHDQQQYSGRLWGLKSADTEGPKVIQITANPSIWSSILLWEWNSFSHFQTFLCKWLCGKVPADQRFLDFNVCDINRDVAVQMLAVKIRSGEKWNATDRCMRSRRVLGAGGGVWGPLWGERGKGKHRQHPTAHPPPSAASPSSGWWRTVFWTCESSRSGPQLKTSVHRNFKCYLFIYCLIIFIYNSVLFLNWELLLNTLEVCIAAFTDSSEGVVWSSYHPLQQLPQRPSWSSWFSHQLSKRLRRLGENKTKTIQFF